jgi:hypothetical protein
MGIILAKYWPHFLGGVLLGLLAIQTWRLGSAHETIDTLNAQAKVSKSALDQCNLSFETGQTEIKVVREAHQLCMSEIATSREAITQAVDRLSEASKVLKDGIRNVEKQRDLIYQDPSCEKLASLDIDTMCPELANSLRNESSKMSSPY